MYAPPAHKSSPNPSLHPNRSSRPHLLHANGLRATRQQLASSVAVSNAPLATIDISSLKPSRFLMDTRNHALAGSPAELPYRDHEGRINLHLCALSEKELSLATSTPGEAVWRLDIPQGVQDTLRAWTRHARAWALKEGPTWTREEGAEGGAAVWVSSAGERLREGGPAAKARPPQLILSPKP